MNAQIIPFKAQRPGVNHALRWSEAIEMVALANLRACFAWQRTWLRAAWGM